MSNKIYQLSYLFITPLYHFIYDIIKQIWHKIIHSFKKIWDIKCNKKGNSYWKKWRGLWIKAQTNQKSTRKLKWRISIFTEVFLNQKKDDSYWQTVNRSPRKVADSPKNDSIFWLQGNILSIKITCPSALYGNGAAAESKRVDSHVHGNSFFIECTPNWERLLWGQKFNLLCTVP